MARPGIAIALSEDERSQLQSMSRSRSLPHSLVRRARIVVLAADGATNAHIAQQCGVSMPTVTHWKKRFAQYGLAGLHLRAVKNPASLTHANPLNVFVIHCLSRPIPL